MSDNESELLSLKWNNHRSTFLQVVGDLRSKASFTDATLACDGKFYPVHRLVLSSCSDYFSAIFDHTTCKSPVVVLKDIESKNLEYLLDYMYIGEVNVRQHELGALVGAAECLKIKGLAVPDDNSSPSHDNIPKNRILNRNRSSSPPNKRKRLSKYLDSPKTNNCGRRTSDSVSSDVPNQSEVISNIKSEPNDPDENSLGENNQINQSFQDSSVDDSKTESNKEDELGKVVIEKEEPVDVDSEKSPSVEGNLIYDNDDDQSWKCEDGFHSDLVSFMTGAVTSEPSCSSQQEDQHLENSLWPPDYLELDSVASTSDQSFDALGSLEEQFGNKVRNGKEQFSKRKVGMRGYDNFLSLHLSSHATLQMLNNKFRRNHLNQRFACHLCPYSSKEKANLKRHMMTHTGEKPFKCPHCEYRSVAYHTIKRHLRTHTGEKPYACSQCEFRCASSETLRNHRLKHA